MLTIIGIGITIITMAILWVWVMRGVDRQMNKGRRWTDKGGGQR